MKHEDYIGKYLLVGITEVDRDGNVLTRSEKHGRISTVGPEGFIVVNPETKEEFTIPPGGEHLQQAQPGDYHLKSCGDVVSNPDYISDWTIHQGDSEEISEQRAG